MKTEWELELSSNYPKQFEQLNKNTYIQRKDIKKREKTDDTIDDPGYECLSRFISKDVYENFMEAMISPSQEQLVNNLTTVRENQSISDDNMMIIMGALADIFELLTP